MPLMVEQPKVAISLYSSFGSLRYCGVKLVVAVLAVLRVVHLMSENLIKRFNLNNLLP